MPLKKTSYLNTEFSTGSRADPGANVRHSRSTFSTGMENRLMQESYFCPVNITNPPETKATINPMSATCSGICLLVVTPTTMHKIRKPSDIRKTLIGALFSVDFLSLSKKSFPEDRGGEPIGSSMLGFSSAFSSSRLSGAPTSMSRDLSLKDAA